MDLLTIGVILICVVGVGVYIIEKRLMEIENVLIAIREKLKEDTDTDIFGVTGDERIEQQLNNIYNLISEFRGDITPPEIRAMRDMDYK